MNTRDYARGRTSGWTLVPSYTEDCLGVEAERVAAAPD